ncbi:MAG: PAS domain S-box protein [Chloroflexota bacterium]|nr:MAG: PAS domain S-box protein [Chloroflexota bacterium]
MRASSLPRGPFWRSARARLFLLVLLVMVPALAVQIAGAWSDLQKEIGERKLEVTHVMAHAQGDFETLLDHSRTVFADLVRVNEIRKPDNCNQAYNSLRLAYERLAPEATNVGLSDVEGNIYCSVVPVFGDLNIAAQPQFQRAMKTLDLSVGAYTLNPLTGTPALSIAYPVLSFNSQVVTVIFVTYELQWLDVWQNEVALPEDTALTLVATDGAILKRSVSGQVVTGSRATALDSAWFATLQDGQTVIEAPDLDGVKRLHTLVPLALNSQSSAYLHLGYPVEELYAKIYQSLQWKLALLILTLLAALGLARWGSEVLLLKPLRHLMDVVGEVQSGNLQARAPAAQGLNELAQLAQAFDRMTDAIQQREAATLQARAGLQESEERFRAVFDNAAVGVAVMSLEHDILQINQKAKRLTGYSFEEISKFNPALLAVEPDREIDRDLFQELVDCKRDQYTVEKRYIRKDGTIFWGRVNFSAVHGNDGQTDYVIGMIEDITEEKQAALRLAAQEAEHRRMLEARIAERTEELNKANTLLSQKAAQEAVAGERTRLARELHDAVTQTLFSATLIADVLPELWELNIVEGRRRLAELHQLTRGALAEMRALLVELRPNALVDAPLSTLCRELTEAVTGRARINVQLNVDGERKLPPDVQIALYRITQEALNNIVKHSKATQAMVTLRLGDTVRLTIADNGAGFDSEAVTADHLGLKIMQERAEAIGARLSIYSEPGEGAQISVTWQ